MSHARPARRRLIKAIVLGEAGCGKTCLLTRFVEDQFEDHYRATIGTSFLAKEMEFESCSVTVQIWDTAGMERHQSLTRAFFHGAECVLLVFDLTDMESFKNLSTWQREFERAARLDDSSSVSFVVMGNKFDLEAARVVSTEEAQAWCDRSGMPYFETSAKTGVNVAEAFTEAVSRALQSEGSGQNGLEFDLDEYIPTASDDLTTSEQSAQTGCCG